MPQYESIDEIVLDCLNRTRPIDAQEFILRYERLCKKIKVMPLIGQAETALRRLKSEGKIVAKDGKCRKI